MPPTPSDDHRSDPDPERAGAPSAQFDRGRGLLAVVLCVAIIAAAVLHRACGG